MKKLKVENQLSHVGSQQAQDEKFELIEEQLLNNVAGGLASPCSDVCLPGRCDPICMPICISE